MDGVVNCLFGSGCDFDFHIAKVLPPIVGANQPNNLHWDYDNVPTKQAAMEVAM